MITEKNVEIEVKDTLLNMKTEAVDTLEEKVCEKIREKQVWSSTHAFFRLPSPIYINLVNYFTI